MPRRRLVVLRDGEASRASGSTAAGVIAPSRVAHLAGRQRSSSWPTIMQVRDATVGPLSGTHGGVGVVDLDLRRTARRARRRRSARAWCGCPGRSRCWPRRMRAPVAVSSSDAFDASLTSPLPVKPEPWKNSDRPMPRPVPRHCPPLLAEARPPHRLAQHRQGAGVRAEALTGRGRVAGRERIASRASCTGSRPSASAMRSMCASTANCVCGAPKPRNAPLGGVWVIIARPRMRT